ncbi:MAG: TolC family protein [Lachnoclostridium sp.]|nr:TolC family protein [Lachnoclostridium sp.]
MNNLRLLTGLLTATLLSGAVCAADGVTPMVVTPEELFEIAESNSTQLRQAFSAEEVARKAVDVARADRLPDINANLSLSYIGDGFTTKRNFSDYQRAPIPHFGNNFGLDVTQPVYTGGAITAGIELAEMKLTASRYAAELQRDNIRFSLTGFYLDIYKYSNLRAVVESNIQSARQVLGEMQARFEQGTALQNDITRYELLVSNLELQLIKIDNTLNILNNNLITIAGLPVDTKILPDSTILSRSLPVSSEQAWLDEASKNAPSIRLAQSELDISRKAETLVKADRLPKIGLKAAWSTEGPILVEVPPINRNLSYWYVGVGVSYDLSSLFKTGKSMARSKAATVNAADRLAATMENTDIAVRADYVRYLEAYEELKTQQKSVELAERNYAVTSTRYSADMALITDMLDAANARLDAEQNLVNARINIIYYYYKLLFTSGKI